MRYRLSAKAVLLFICCLVVVVFCQCKKVVFCPVKDLPVSIDGDYKDWGENLTAADDERLFYGIMHDSTNYFLCLLVKDNELKRQITRAGLTTWFSAEGGKNKSFGLEYPIGFSNQMGNKSESDMMKQNMQNRRDRSEAPPSHDDMLSHPQFQSMLNDVGIKGEKEDILTVTNARIYGIETALNFIDRDLVIEIKVPLKSSDTIPFAVAEFDVKKVGLGFESKMPELDTMGSGMPGRGPGGRGGSGSRGGRGMSNGRMRGGGPPGGFQPTQSKNIQFWLQTSFQNNRE